ncbi:Hok/gef family protein [Buttiauxella sp. BIGb0552]|nr:Hok/gef family protein [Buttiauxella sp. BIGb0552]
MNSALEAFAPASCFTDCLWQKAESPEKLILINLTRPPVKTRHLHSSFIPAEMQGSMNMKQPRQTVIWCLLIVCLTLLIFTGLTRSKLCELRFKDGNREVAATLAYEPGK